MSELLPLFLNLTGRAVVLVGGGPVATAKLRQLLAAGARVRVIAPEITDEIRQVAAQGFPASAGGRDDPAMAWLAEAPEARGRQPRDRGPERAAPRPDATCDPVRVTIVQRSFVPADLDGAWLVVAAATPEVNRHVAEVAETLRLFVNAVDDPANATAFLSGVVRRDGVTLAISTSGAAPALTALLREGLEALLPRDLATWVWQARVARVAWRREGVPMNARKPRLLQALNALYQETAEPPSLDKPVLSETLTLRQAQGQRRVEELRTSAHAEPVEPRVTAISAVERGPRVPWLNGPEDSWL